MVVSLARTRDAWNFGLLDSDEKSAALNLTPAPEFKCERLGRFANPKSCEKYYYCWDTVHDHAIFSCTHHKAFDPKSQLCVHNFAVCASAPECEVDLQFLPNPFDKSSYFQCSLISPDQNATTYYSDTKYRLYKKICTRGGEFDADLGYCKLTAANENEDDSSDSDESIDKLECGKAGVFIDRSSDRRYYECVTKSVTYAKIHQTCPNNHVFSMEDKRCVRLDADEK